ncbi:helix-turn-helix domain-containing protein [Vibrio vulnificus]|uniref:helix-turn-helix domain-containing protein n=1 Tax=Vibrio vulnificus TaxID=672 RepID=UPI001FAEC73B|nr:helix-turn-helix transcriptional regulator [Vibrio vulnificus]MCJ0817976.1 helix-turn-helix domain-containing protein [Vibrio vulnificus]
MDLSFDERLNFVLKDRKQTPWGKSLGFTGASISHIFSGGRIPGPEFLQAIRRAENVNLNWLLTGEGAPYIVEYYQSADALSDYVCAMLHEEEWVVHVCSYRGIACVVFTQPGHYEFKGKWIDYRIVHVVVGPGDEVLTNLLHDYHKGGGHIFVPELTEEEREAVIQGQVGTYLMFEQMNPMLNTIRVETHITEIEFTGGERTEKPVDITIMRAVVRLVDDCEHTLGTSLTSDQRARVITAVYRQAERLKLTEEEIQATIETSFDVLSD